MEHIRVTHFSDTLCVWAYVSQIRIDELLRNFSGSVELEYRYPHVFGDVPKKMETSWKDRGGVQGYNEHVKTACGKFGHVALDPGFGFAPHRSPRCQVTYSCVRSGCSNPTA
jgi:hypothetical protein